MSLKVMKVHPAAAAFPVIKSKEFNELKADIVAHGIKQPIIVNKAKDQIIDGRNRYMIANELKMKQEDVPFEVFKGTEEDIVNEVISRNILRRHLSDEQRIAIITKLRAPQIEAEAAADKKSGKGAKKGKGETADRLAAEAQTTQHKGRQALDVAKHGGKGALEKVIEGKKKLGKAAKEARAKKPKSTKKKKEVTLEDEVTKRFHRFMDHWPVTMHRDIKKILRKLID